MNLTSMMTRKRSATMRKPQVSQQDSKLDSSEPESSELPKILTPKESKSAAVQNSHDNGDRYSEDEETASDGNMLTRAVLLMSNELRNQNKRVFDIEQCLYDWMKTLEGLVQHCDSLVKQTKSRETESRGTQCDLTQIDPPVEKKKDYAQATKSTPTQVQDGVTMASKSSDTSLKRPDERKVNQASRRSSKSGNDVSKSTSAPDKYKDIGTTKTPVNHKKKVNGVSKTDDVSSPASKKIICKQ